MMRSLTDRGAWKAGRGAQGWAPGSLPGPSVVPLLRLWYAVLTDRSSLSSPVMPDVEHPSSD